MGHILIVSLISRTKLVWRGTAKRPRSRLCWVFRATGQTVENGVCCDIRHTGSAQLSAVWAGDSSVVSNTCYSYRGLGWLPSNHIAAHNHL